jgi:hypothetical protein
MIVVKGKLGDKKKLGKEFQFFLSPSWEEGKKKVLLGACWLRSLAWMDFNDEDMNSLILNS